MIKPGYSATAATAAAAYHILFKKKCLLQSTIVSNHSNYEIKIVKKRERKKCESKFSRNEIAFLYHLKILHLPDKIQRPRIHCMNCYSYPNST
jgi:hypothetical protein